LVPHERVEVIFRLKDPALCHKVCSEIVLPYFADTEKARFLLASGQYASARKDRVRTPDNGTRFNVQEFFVDVAENREGRVGSLPAPLLQKLRNSPIYEALLAQRGETETGATESGQTVSRSTRQRLAENAV